MKFSIIIPSHNGMTHGGLIPCMFSVKKQTYKDYELIVVADACDDDTAAVARRNGARVVETNFRNDGYARNAGLDVAQGDWILWLDDDDYWIHEYVLESMVDKLTDDIDLLVFGFIWKEHGYCLKWNGEKNVMYANVWSKCYRRSFIGDTRLTEYCPKAADLKFNNLLLQKCPRFAYWDAPVYYYNWMRPGSMTEIAAKGEQNAETCEQGIPSYGAGPSDSGDDEETRLKELCRGLRGEV